eukprot:CAMPEP_0119320990 /NCGR_PEP_ID=MMETSP1333-20130426/54071_1 /TAXON_ID=418940 /ORGANISM="Scyphosphaera apsteinii, Strain RCC1455" /LENGTH=187 /DNA_ID=CAMNT_0007327839 /DNA_START=77 /DNA_END=640 /DNA_ORIENTATION=+
MSESTRSVSPIVPAVPIITPSLREFDVKLALFLSPAFLGNALTGVRNKLNLCLLRYVDRLGGILLGYQNLKLVDHFAIISGDDPNLHIPVTMRALVFAPAIGEVLEGEITRLGKDHIALLVHGVFNASISIPAAKRTAEARRNAGHEVGDRIVFTVDSIHVADGLLSMKGSTIHSVSSSSKLAAESK